MARGQPGTGEQTSYSVSEAARLLGLSESAIRKRIDRGALQVSSPTGAPLRVVASDVEAEHLRLIGLLGAATRPSDAVAELERELIEARDACIELQARVDRLERQLRDRQAAWEALLAAHAALQDALRHSTFDSERMND